MGDVVWVQCGACGYSNRVFLVKGKPDDEIVEVDGWTPGEVVGDRQTWICQTCAKSEQ